MFVPLECRLGSVQVSLRGHDEECHAQAELGDPLHGGGSEVGGCGNNTCSDYYRNPADLAEGWAQEINSSRTIASAHLWKMVRDYLNTFFG